MNFQPLTPSFCIVWVRKYEARMPFAVLVSKLDKHLSRPGSDNGTCVCDDSYFVLIIS
jgi:hypothetical protein